MQENKFTPEDFLPRGPGEETLKKDLEKIRAAGETGSVGNLIDASREADLKITLSRYDDIRETQNELEERYRAALKSVEAKDAKLTAAYIDGLYKRFNLVLDNLKLANEELENLSKRYWAKEHDYQRLKERSGK